MYCTLNVFSINIENEVILT